MQDLLDILEDTLTKKPLLAHNLNNPWLTSEIIILGSVEWIGKWGVPLKHNIDLMPFNLLEIVTRNSTHLFTLSKLFIIDQK